MSGTTSVPSPTFGPTGFVAPPESDILQGVLEDMNAAFGGDLVIADANGNPEVRTPQGQLASSIAASIGDQNDQMLALFNGVDPALATGRMQDAIGRIYYIERMPARATVVSVVCIGAEGTSIPAGTPLGADDGLTYYASSGGTIGADERLVTDFVCSVTGPVACPAGALHKMMQLIPGWDAASNPADGVLGRDVETPQQFEARRSLSVAHNSIGSIPSVQGALLLVSGIVDAFVTDNVTADPVVIDGVTVPSHGLYVCVSGGSDADVAYAIWRKKMPGCSYAAGNTTVTVTDPSPNYAPGEAPTYAVTFQRAAAQTLVMTVTMVNNPGVPSNVEDLVRQAVLAAFAGEDGGPSAKIGQAVFALRFVPPIGALGLWARQIVSIRLGSTGAPTASFTGAISGNALTVSGVTGTIAIGQTLIAAGVPDGTTITAGSGTSWTISVTLGTVASEAMVSVLAALDEVSVGYAHIPTLVAENITVVVS